MTSRPKKSGEHPAPLVGSRRRGIVLLLDDEASLLAALERKFRLAGLFPISARTIAEAWTLLDTWLVHCIVADHKLDDGPGAHFLVDIGRQFPGVGRVLLTGFLDGEIEGLAKDNGFAAFDKACSFAELLAAVRREIGADG
jgi:adenylate cyclase